MISLTQYVVDLLADSELSFSPTVRRAYDSVVDTLPLVVVEELDNTEMEFATVVGEVLSFIPLQIDVYAGATVDEDIVYAADEVVTRIAVEIAEVCVHVNLTRVYARMIPFDKEDTTRRFTLRYEAVVDQEGYITKSR